jgi:di/tricarboxylate transporter
VSAKKLGSFLVQAQF